MRYTKIYNNQLLYSRLPLPFHFDFVLLFLVIERPLAIFSAASQRNLPIFKRRNRLQLSPCRLLMTGQRGTEQIVLFAVAISRSERALLTQTAINL